MPEVEPNFKSAPPIKLKGKKREPSKRARDAAELKQAKAQVLLRSRGRCEARGFSELCTGYGAHLHHVVRRSQGGDNSPANLLHCCEPCHRKIHDNPAEALVRGFLKPGGDVA